MCFFKEANKKMAVQGHCIQMSLRMMLFQKHFKLFEDKTHHLRNPKKGELISQKHENH